MTMSRVIYPNTIITPDLADLNSLMPYAVYGIYSHLFILATDKDGKRETIHLTQEVDSFRHQMMCENGYCVHRRIADNGDLHIVYEAPGITCYNSSTDAMKALEDEGYTDVRYSSDHILVILPKESLWIAVKKGVLKTKGA